MVVCTLKHLCKDTERHNFCDHYLPHEREEVCKNEECNLLEDLGIENYKCECVDEFVVIIKEIIKEG